ncbi:pyridoxal phosphate-dependent transferase [Plectosphaerella cucumerina]|uniref:Pyridoxal phosphate-dependent transferase n=1 Tax=Plectosphaerella cucumerina TaxID=40658 RepID=A0A8K0TM97_9PEZI|nr:pyridoxal phosphate-dependent transferase [Plectosphaerella cucumerina]
MGSISFSETPLHVGDAARVSRPEPALPLSPPSPARTLQLQLDQAITGFISKNPSSWIASQRAQKGLPSGTTRAVLSANPFPLVVASGHGAQLTTLDNDTYVDLQSDFTSGLFGHSHPDIQAAIIQATKNGFSLGAVTTLEAELSESIKVRFPSIDQIRFCNSGTEANIYAIAAALAYTGRRKVLIFDSGYHGGSLSFSEGANPLNIPHDYVFGTYNDIEKTRSVLSGEIGVIVVEPMQSAGGMRPANVEFLRFLRSAADILGCVLIFDEVVTSRLDHGGLQGRYRIFPDMTTLGKYLGGGSPFGAFGGKKPIMDQFDPTSKAPTKLFHSGTFNNNTFTMSAGVAAAKIVTKSAIERTNTLGDRARQGINEMAMERNAQVKAIGIGSCVGIQFLDGETSSVLKELLFFHLLSRGFWIGRRGFLSLSFANTEDHVEDFLGAFGNFLNLYM